MINTPQPNTWVGTYALLLRIDVVTTVAIGQRRQMALAPGWGVYVGSAFGPGGVQARLAHHRRSASRPRWHIDYLRRYSQIAAIWFSHDPMRRECMWAEVLAADLGGQSPPFRFGASDCRCPTHLYLFPDRPHWSAFTTAVQQRAPDHATVLEDR